MNTLSERQEKRRIMKSCRLVQESMGVPHSLRWEHKGSPPMVIESYLYVPVNGITFPKLPISVIGILLDGRRVRNVQQRGSALSASSDETPTLPNRCALVPRDTATHWNTSPGSVHFAGVYIGGAGQAALQLLTTGNVQAMTVRDGVLAALTRQLLQIAQDRPDALSTDYESQLVNAFTAQLHWLTLTRPHDGKGRSTLSDRAISQALQLIDAHLENAISIDWLCESVHENPTLFRRRFRALTGMPVHQYIITRRVERAREMIEDTNLPLSTVAAHCGFSSHSHLSAVFKRITGATPGEHRQK